MRKLKVQIHYWLCNASRKHLFCTIASSGEAISVKNIYVSLGPLKSSAQPGFHAISGCDTTGSLFGKGKLSCWEAFVSASEEELTALQKLGTSDLVPDDVLHQLEIFICRVYEASTLTKSLAELRWSMFTIKQALGDKLPPIRSSLVPAIKRANLQNFVWSKDDEPNVVQLDTAGIWKKECLPLLGVKNHVLQSLFFNWLDVRVLKIMFTTM